MSKLRLLSLIDVCAGGWLLAAPFALHLPRSYPHQLSFLTSLVIGAAVLLLSALHGLQWEGARRASRVNVSLGLLLVASPLSFGYGQAHGAGRSATVNAVVSGLVIVAGAALCLAASDERAAAPGRVQPAPALWTGSAGGGAPHPFASRVDAQEGSRSEQERARGKLPYAWAAVGLMIAGAVLLGLAIVLASWAIAIAGFVIGAVGVAIALRVRILSDVSLGQRPEGA